MSKLRQLFNYHFQGLGTKRIKLMTGISRNTIKRYLRQLNAYQFNQEAILSMSDQALDELFRADPPVPPMDRMEALFKFFDNETKRLRKRGVTLLQLWHDYRLIHPDGFQQTSYYHYYSIWKKRTDPSMHMEHKAGDKMFVDFAGEKLKIVDTQTGEIKLVEVFVAILGASQLTYVEAVYSQKVEEFIGACENAILFFGGSPAAVVPDNLKSAVTKTHKYEPWLNENFAIFAEHYGMAVLPARVRRPKDKSLVEGAVKITYQRIYAKIHDQTFTSLEELNAAILHHLEVHNYKSFQGRNYSRRQQFEEMEKSTLQPLPFLRFEMYKSVFVTAMKNSHVSLTVDKHYYSVPYHYIGKKVKLMFSRSLVRIFYRYELIAEHPRMKSPHNYSTIKEHLPGEQRHMLEWNPDKFLNEAKDIHPDVEFYIRQVLLNKQHPEQAYRSCQGILSFAKRIGKDRLILACKRAHEVGWYNYRTIENILKKGLDRELLEETKLHMPAHENIRGKDYYS